MHVCNAMQFNAMQGKMEQGWPRMEPRWPKKNEERKKKEERRPKKEREGRKKTNLYTLTPVHPALLAPYYLISNI